ncbi:MAG: DUF615 domain-containing protein [Gammaproteobacteria bacterium]|nr:DUF615 domain-containing protein [Gammaproteobacteria bacterium]
MSDYHHDQEPPSKSQLKKDMTALQKIGEALIKLSESQLAQVPLPDRLRDAIYFARSLKTHESIRRQLQYIGKLMREVDPEPLRLALKKIQYSHELQTRSFNHIEAWREKLIAQGDPALQQFIENYADADRQLLRQLIRKAQHDRDIQKNSGAETELFRYLRNFVQE